MFFTKISKFFSDESGASLVEYALIAALITVGALGALTGIGGGVQGALDTVSTTINP